MSWEDVDKPSGGSGLGRFVAFEDGKAVRMRLLDEEPHTTRVHKISQIVTRGGKSEEVYRAIPATVNPDDNYILKHNPKRYPENTQFSMRAFVYNQDENNRDTDEGEIKILQGGPAIFKQLRTIYQNEGSLTQFDVVITRRGEKRDTEYTVSAAARSRNIDVKKIIGQMESDPDLQWDRIFLPTTGEMQKKILDEAGMDVNYDPAAVLALEMSPERAATAMFTFGKYKGKTVGEVKVIDSGYLSWAAENVTSNDELAAACRISSGLINQLAEASEPRAIADSESRMEKPAPKAEKPAPKAEKPKPDKKSNLEKAEELMADTNIDRDAVKAEIQDWFESDPTYEDVQEVVTIIKKHGDGKTRLKDLSAQQMVSLLNELKKGKVA